MRTNMEGWREEVRRAHARGEYSVFAKDIEVYVIEVNLSSPEDPDLSEELQAIPTTLQLSHDEVTLLRRHARAQLKASPEYQRLLRELN